MASTDTPPLVTVAVCTRNRGASLAPTVETILANTEPTLELLVIDQSDDDTTEIAAKTAANGDPRLRYMSTATRGIYRSRSLAVQEAAGTYVLFTDDDCTVPTDWASTMVRVLESHPKAGMAFCTVHAVEHDWKLGTVPAYDVAEDFVLERPYDRARRRGLGAGMAVVRERALEIGNFDAALNDYFAGFAGEETDLALRMLCSGYPVVETGQTSVLHDGYRTWEQVRAMDKRNWHGSGIISAKNIRGHGRKAVSMALYEGIVIGIINPIVDKFPGLPRGIRGSLHFWTGFVRGFGPPMSSDTSTFAPAETPIDAAPRPAQGQQSSTTW